MSDLHIENINGRITKFGPEGTEGKFGRTVSRVGDEVQVEYIFDWNALPTAGVNEMIHTIPSGSYLRSTELVVLTPFAGTDGAAGSDFITVGTYTPEGSALDADGLITVDALTEVDSLNATVVGAGALVGTASAADSQVQVTLDGSSSLTAGKAVVRLRYVPATAAAAGTKTY